MDYKKYFALPPLNVTADGTYNYFAGLIDGGKILEVDEYDRKSLTKRWFFDNSGKRLQWVQCNYKSQKRTSRTKILACNYWCYDMNAKDKATVNSYFIVKNDLKSVYSLQEEILNRKKTENKNFITGINQQIDNIPIPEGLENWIREKVINGDCYIFYHFVKNWGVGIGGVKTDFSHYEGYCTRCNQNFEFWEKPTHNEVTFCPMCGSAGQYKAEGMSRKKMTHTANIAFAQSMEDGQNFVVRCFHVTRDYSGDYKVLKSHLKEFARYYFTPKRVWYSKNEMKYGMGGHIDRLNYYNLTEGFEIFDGQYFFYQSNFLQVLKNSYLSRKLAAIEDFLQSKDEDSYNKAWECQIELLRTLSVYPTLEYLIKMKLYGLVKSVLRTRHCSYNSSLNLKGKTAEQVLGMKINQLKRFENYEKMSNSDLETAQYCIKNGLEEFYNLIRLKCYYNKDVIDEIGKIVPIKKALNYIEKNALDFRNYYDYISGCKKLNYDLNDTMILKPKEFVKAHDAVTVLIKVQKNQILEIPIQTAYAAYRKLVEWSDKNITVLMAKDGADIIREGQQQNHCVGRYCERVAKGESLILFLRHVSEPDKGFYTMEIRPDMRKLNNIQCRGYHNEDPSLEAAAEIEAFLKKYEKWFNRRPTTGFDSGKVMAKYYKAVRKLPDGRYISGHDGSTEFKIGEFSETEMDTNPDAVAVKGLHIASLEFAQNFGNHWKDVAILEVEVNLNDVIVPDAVDQIRTSKFRVLREVPMKEMGEWGEKHMKNDELLKTA